MIQTARVLQRAESDCSRGGFDKVLEKREKGAKSIGAQNRNTTDSACCQLFLKLLSILNRSLFLSFFLFLHAVLFARPSARFDRVLLQPLSIPMCIILCTNLGNVFGSLRPPPPVLALYERPEILVQSTFDVFPSVMILCYQATATKCQDIFILDK